MKKLLLILSIAMFTTTCGAQTLTNQNKIDWNRFLIYLQDKNIRGARCLDSNNLGNKLFFNYIKTNKTTLSVELIPVIRKEYINLRNELLTKIKAGKANCKYDENHFMKFILDNEKTNNPNYIGFNLTQTFFPVVANSLNELDKPGSKIFTQNNLVK